MHAMRSLDVARGTLTALLASGSLAALVSAQLSCSVLSGLSEYRIDEAGEICTDGVDDDGDTFVDCADPGCGAFSCAPLAGGFEGPFLVYEGPYSGPPPACADGSTPALFVSGAAPDAACSPCACGAATGACLVPALECSATADCAMPSTIEPLLDACVDAALPGASCRHDPFVPDPASLACDVTGGEVVGDAFDVRLALCSTRGEGCDGGACLPIDATARRCVRASGDVACPGGYPDKRLVHSSGADTRACSPCSCELETSPTCVGGQLTLSAPGCAGAPLATTPQSGVCSTLPGIAAGDYGVEVTPATLAGGSCGTPSVSIPSGEVTVPDTSTLCCEAP